MASVNLEESFMVIYELLKKVAEKLKTTYSNKNEKNVEIICNWTILTTMRVVTLIIKKFNSNSLLGSLKHTCMQILESLYDYYPSTKLLPF